MPCVPSAKWVFSNFIPLGLPASSRAAPGRRGGREQVTVLFADAKGSMGPAEQLDLASQIG